MMSAVVIAALVLLAAASGAIFKPGAWYDTLAKPSWTPPPWAFPVVWTVLYVLIGYAGWIVWSRLGPSPAMAAWVAQLVFNGAWSWLFFGRRRMDLAFVDVSALLASIVLFMVLAWPAAPEATLAFVPYLAWVIAAATLNRAVWRLNPGQAHG